MRIPFLKSFIIQQINSNILSEIQSIPAECRHFFISDFACLPERITLTRDGNDPTTFRDDVITIFFCTGVKDQSICSGREPVNDLAFAEIAGITTASQRDRHGMVPVYLYAFAFQLAAGCSYQDFSEIAFYPGHDSLRFGVTHTGVIFDYERASAHIHNTHKNKSFVV